MKLESVSIFGLINGYHNQLFVYVSFFFC